MRNSKKKPKEEQVSSLAERTEALFDMTIGEVIREASTPQPLFRTMPESQDVEGKPDLKSDMGESHGITTPANIDIHNYDDDDGGGGGDSGGDCGSQEKEDTKAEENLDAKKGGTAQQANELLENVRKSIAEVSNCVKQEQQRWRSHTPLEWRHKLKACTTRRCLSSKSASSGSLSRVRSLGKGRHNYC